MGYFGCQSDLGDEMVDYVQQNCGEKHTKSWRMACFDAKLLVENLLFHSGGYVYAFDIL